MKVGVYVWYSEVEFSIDFFIHVNFSLHNLIVYYFSIQII